MCCCYFDTVLTVSRSIQRDRLGHIDSDLGVFAIFMLIFSHTVFIELPERPSRYRGHNQLSAGKLTAADGSNHPNALLSYCGFSVRQTRRTANSGS
jgi:hypothetical protein